MHTIRIKSKGLPKAQYQNSQVGVPTIPNPFSDPQRNIDQFAPQMEQEDLAEQANQQNYQNWLQDPRNEMTTQSWAQPFLKDFNLRVPAFDPKKKYDKRGREIKPKKPSDFANKLSNIGAWSGIGLSALAAGVNHFENKKRQKDWDSWFRQQNLPENMYAVSPGGDRGDFDPNQGIFRPNQLTPPNMGAASVARYGGTQFGEDGMNLIKIRLRQPTMKYGGQSGLGMGLDIGQRRVYTHMPKDKEQHVSDKLNAVPRNQANIEAEKGETAYADMDGDGALEHFVIGGKRHTHGGTPLKVPEGSFIFSDTKKMIIKDPEILQEFGMAFRKGGYTPAEIAKKYDINKYKAIMEDPNMDQVRKSTAQLMIKNFQKKLGKLALIQESMKGFPQGVPEVALQTIPEAAMIQESLQQTQNFEQGMDEDLEDQDMEAQEQAQYEDDFEDYGMEEEMPEARYGGLPRYQGAGVVPYPGDQETSPTGLSNKYAEDATYLQEWESRIPGISRMNNSQAQTAIYNWSLQNDPSLLTDMWKKWGLTKKGQRDRKLLKLTDYDPTTRTYIKTFNNRTLTQKDLEALREAYVDDMFGGRSIRVPQQPQTVTQPTTTTTTMPPTPGTTTTTTIPPGDIPEDIPGDEGSGWMAPDIINIGAAAAIPPVKRLPYIAPAPYEPNRLSLEDWRAQAAQRQAMYNKQAEVMGVYGPTTGQGAFQSSAAGQQAEALAGDIAGVTSRNVDRVNQFLQNERQRKDQFNLLGANRATELYKGNVIANQQYDNARREYLNNIAKTYGQGWKNASMLGMLNAVNPFFKFNPRSGLSYFTRRGYGADRLGRGSSSGSPTDWGSIQAAYLRAKAQSPDLDYNTFLRVSGLDGRGQQSGDGGFNAASFLPLYQAGLFGPGQ